MLYAVEVTVSSQINTKHINTVWAERTIGERQNMLVHHVTSRFRLQKPTLHSTHVIQRNPTWEAKRLSASIEVPLLLRNPEVHDRVYKSPILVRVLCHAKLSTLISALSLSLHQFLPRGLFPRPSFPAKISCFPLNDTTRATWMSHLPLLVAITLITSSDGKNYESIHPSVLPILVLLLLFLFRYSLKSLSRTFIKSRWN